MKNRARRIVLLGALAASVGIAALAAAASQGKTDSQAAPAAKGDRVDQARRLDFRRQHQAARSGKCWPGSQRSIRRSR